MSAREQILGNIRAANSALAGDKVPGPRSAETHGPLPDWPEERLERFVAKLESVSAEVTRVKSPQEAIQAIAGHLQKHDLPRRLVMSDQPLVQGLPWPEDWEVTHRPARGDDVVSVTSAFAAIAETGSVVMLSSAKSPVTLNFLPDDHLVVMRESQVVDHLEDMWTLLRKQESAMPRTVNIITGPSRTADVEQTIQLGAHGPRRLHVVLLAE